MSNPLTQKTSDLATVEIDFISDIVCPWCAIAFHQLKAASENTGVDVKISWQPFELNPKLPKEGQNFRAHMAEKYGTTLEGSIRSRERISAIGGELGFKFDYFDEMRMYNTFKAHQLVNYAGDYDKSQDVSIKLFEAFFGQRQDISDIETLVKIADSVGLPDDNVRKVLEEESRAMAVRTRQRYWTNLRVSSVPTVVIRPSFAVSGAQGVDTYSKILLGAQRN